eukprot:1159805-Pelagomonas_calceolata.AAC.5
MVPPGTLLFAHYSVHVARGKGGEGTGSKGVAGSICPPPPFTHPSLLAYRQTPFEQCIKPRTLSNCAQLNLPTPRIHLPWCA